MENETRELKITKTFSRKISANYGQSVDFGTVISTTIHVRNAEELRRESAKVFEQAKQLTLADIDANREYLENALLPYDKQQR